jgi:hypothetical protein
MVVCNHTTCRISFDYGVGRPMTKDRSIPDHTSNWAISELIKPTGKKADIHHHLFIIERILKVFKL